jgi:hypothetical protein
MLGLYFLELDMQMGFEGLNLKCMAGDALRRIAVRGRPHLCVSSLRSTLCWEQHLEVSAPHLPLRECRSESWFARILERPIC